MKRYFTLIVFFLAGSLTVIAQSGQLTVNRVSQMPDIPTPYLMRDWKLVATNYDELVFSTTIAGEYLPLIDYKSTGINYPDLSPILLQTYVGTNSANQAEAINIMPSIISASLVGIDKSNQNGINWVEKTKDFFNKANGQNVYLNGYSATSGGDWWYDVMPNIFFYQLASLYPNTSDYEEQFISVADRWLTAVHTMGGSTTPWTIPNMNYRAWNLSTMTGLSDGVKEPEAAGSIGWLLYNAYLKTGEKKYLYGAQQCLEFLSGLTSNPSYELQLPYGAFIAAKMNAELGTAYDVSKIVNWCFDRGPLRGWGSITGTWNGADVDGLIGEANDGGNDYAFIMNGFQQAGALVPLIKYDKRYARAIAKWTLNVANASRLFYSLYLPEASQDDYGWSSTNDPNSTIAYEALKEVWEGKPLYGTGDAKRNGWAETNLGLYGSSHVGYLGAVVETTDVEGILLLNANKTDFFEEDNDPTYVLYNPYSQDKVVNLTLPSGTYDIYDAISETIQTTGANGSVPITVKADEALLLVYVPSGTSTLEKDGKLYAGDQVIDYHYGYDFNPPVRIKSLAVADTLVEFDQQVPIYATVENAGESTTYSWKVNGEVISTSMDEPFTWTVPETSGRTVLTLKVDSDSESTEDSLVFNVVENIPTAPVIESLSQDQLWYATGTEAVFTCNATDDENMADELDYQWTVDAGSIVSTDGKTLIWQTPQTEGLYEISCEVTDQDGLKSTAKKMILVRQLSVGTTPPFAYYPFDGNSQDYSGNGHYATKAGVESVADSRGEAGKAYQFNSVDDIIAVENTSELNFRNKITLSFWVKLNSLTQESFILSHGSWEERWKVSVTPDGHRLRWTVKTDEATKDLDSSFPLELGKFYHFTVVYSGFSMEMYADGKLDNFISQAGLMGTTSKPLTMGRKDNEETMYHLNGTVDEVRIYNASLSPDEIATLKGIWNTHNITAVDDGEMMFNLFPNPSTGEFYLTGYNKIVELKIYNLNGKLIEFSSQSVGNKVKIRLKDTYTGILLIEIQTADAIHHSKIILKNF